MRNLGLRISISTLNRTENFEIEICLTSRICRRDAGGCVIAIGLGTRHRRLDDKLAAVADISRPFRSAFPLGAEATRWTAHQLPPDFSRIYSYGGLNSRPLSQEQLAALPETS